ncbi:MAG: hypothetical protein ACR2GL_05525 [Thermoleophilaceae bacterium]
MQPSGDLAPEALAEALAGSPVRSYAALVSTGSAALAWAQEGAPDGAVVVADHQLSPRGHAGRPWKAAPGEGLGLSIVLRPRLTAEREGWLYTIVLAALAEVCGEGTAIEWPDEIRAGTETVAAIGIKTLLGPTGVDLSIVDVLLPAATPPRGEVIGSIIAAVAARRAEPSAAVLARYERACATIGRDVRVRFRAGTGPVVGGRVVGALEDGAILLEQASGRRAPVRPQDVRGLEAP